MFNFRTPWTSLMRFTTAYQIMGIAAGEVFFRAR
jgi:hypothetical protein